MFPELFAKLGVDFASFGPSQFCLARSCESVGGGVIERHGALPVLFGPVWQINQFSKTAELEAHLKVYCCFQMI